MVLMTPLLIRPLPVAEDRNTPPLSPATATGADETPPAALEADSAALAEVAAGEGRSEAGPLPLASLEDGAEPAAAADAVAPETGPNGAAAAVVETTAGNRGVRPVLPAPALPLPAPPCPDKPPAPTLLLTLLLPPLSSADRATTLGAGSPSPRKRGPTALGPPTPPACCCCCDARIAAACSAALRTPRRTAAPPLPRTASMFRCSNMRSSISCRVGKGGKRVGRKLIESLGYG